MDSIRLSRSDGIATITIDRPERKNALGYEHFMELGRLATEVAMTRSDRVLVLTGAGGDFCAGADLVASEATERGALDRMNDVGTVARAIRDLSKPTIAKVDGVAVGAGANLALCCDLIVASDRTRFSEIFSRRALSLDFGGSWLLPRAIGLARAKELAFFGDIIGADELVELGLVNRAMPAGELDEFVATWARRLAAGPSIALSLTKELLDSAETTTFSQALAAEARAQTINLSTADAREAFSAFAAKREPKFEGR